MLAELVFLEDEVELLFALTLLTVLILGLLLSASYLRRHYERKYRQSYKVRKRKLETTS